MTPASDAMKTVRTGLYQQIEALEAGYSAMPLSQIVEQVDTLRRTAQGHGLVPLADMAHGFETMLAWSRGGPAIAPWIAAMKEAVTCETLDRHSVRAWLAALGHRIVH
jgi:hypothetical protein